MGIERESPKITVLRKITATKYGKPLSVHSDFVELADKIRNELKAHISETTLERVWGYSTRGYSNVSLHTLNMLSRYCGYSSWQNFEEWLKDHGEVNSDLFMEDVIYSDELSPGDKLKIGWSPDRICTIQYLGENRFKALECENSTLQPGDTFRCLEFMKNQPAIMSHLLVSDDNTLAPKRYVAGIKDGLTLLNKL